MRLTGTTHFLQAPNDGTLPEARIRKDSRSHLQARVGLNRYRRRVKVLTRWLGIEDS